MATKYLIKDGKTEAYLSEIASWELFDSIAHTIGRHFGGHWIERLDGIEQRYWDLEINGIVVTLHLEHYLGISLFPASSTSNITTANSLVETIGAFIEESFGTLEAA